MTHWQLQAQYESLLKDTVIRRWRDPANGMICYIHLPVSPRGAVQYAVITL